MAKKVKMKFRDDAFVDGVCIAKAGEIVDINEESVDRWIRRGAVVVDEHAQEPEVPAHQPVKPVVPEEPKGDNKTGHRDQVNNAKPKKGKAHKAGHDDL